MISRCSDARERTVNRNEWSSETTTDDTIAGYRRTPATSIDAMRTVLAGTAWRVTTAEKGVLDIVGAGGEETAARDFEAEGAFVIA
jgi:hypothetical protein